MLKVKYNELLARYNKGAEYLAKNPNDEKAMEEFNKISDELNNIIEAIPNMTDKEKTEGFVIKEKIVQKPIVRFIESSAVPLIIFTAHLKNRLHKLHLSKNLLQSYQPFQTIGK